MNKIIRINIYLLALLLVYNNAKSQYYPLSFYESTKIDSSNSKTLFFKVQNSNFLKNNEYFGDFIQGYTLIGYNLTPSIVYYPTKNTKIEIGAHMQKYSGVKDFTKAVPILRFHYKATKWLDVVIGRLYGAANHDIIEPMFRHEFFYTDPIENGLQFLFNTKIYKGDIWINWQQFIFAGEDKQEIFTLGLSNRLFIRDRNEKHSFSIPLQSIFIHQGGQINKTKKKLITLNNSSAGINYRYTHKGFLKYADFESSFVTFNDMSTEHQFPYIQGYGILSMATVKAGFFELRLAHWYGDSYMSGRGLPVFSSVSTIYDDYTEDKRATINTRFMFEKNIIKGLDVGAGFEVYSDLYNYTGDYWYLFYINFNREFFLKKLKMKN